ncbi:hypothetical protein LTR86_003855 [Recurvomyces mirabilis]|nr:hypothetical protein LTR86_003855 [Recurvomyces mirabilis]
MKSFSFAVAVIATSLLSYAYARPATTSSAPTIKVNPTTTSIVSNDQHATATADAATLPTPMSGLLETFATSNETDFSNLTVLPSDLDMPDPTDRTKPSNVLPLPLARTSSMSTSEAAALEAGFETPQEDLSDILSSIPDTDQLGSTAQISGDCHHCHPHHRPKEDHEGVEVNVQVDEDDDDDNDKDEHDPHHERPQHGMGHEYDHEGYEDDAEDDEHPHHHFGSEHEHQDHKEGLEHDEHSYHDLADEDDYEDEWEHRWHPHHGHDHKHGHDEEDEDEYAALEEDDDEPPWRFTSEHRGHHDKEDGNGHDLENLGLHDEHHDLHEHEMHDFPSTGNEDWHKHYQHEEDGLQVPREDIDGESDHHRHHGGHMDMGGLSNDGPDSPDSWTSSHLGDLLPLEAEMIEAEIDTAGPTIAIGSPSNASDTNSTAESFPTLEVISMDSESSITDSDIILAVSDGSEDNSTLSANATTISATPTASSVILSTMGSVSPSSSTTTVSLETKATTGSSSLPIPASTSLSSISIYLAMSIPTPNSPTWSSSASKSVSSSIPSSTPTSASLKASVSTTSSSPSTSPTANEAGTVTITATETGAPGTTTVSLPPYRSILASEASGAMPAAGNAVAGLVDKVLPFTSVAATTTTTANTTASTLGARNASASPTSTSGTAGSMMRARGVALRLAEMAAAMALLG